jgi:hypothetical protein
MQPGYIDEYDVAWEKKGKKKKRKERISHQEYIDVLFFQHTRYCKKNIDEMILIISRKIIKWDCNWLGVLFYN